jgi:hypothetical protein
MVEEIVEGTWEEIARQGDRFSGRRVRLTVLSGEASGFVAASRPLYETATPQELVRALDKIAVKNRQLPVLPPEAFERESLYADDGEV